LNLVGLTGYTEPLSKQQVAGRVILASARERIHHLV
jgi:hypothetical protein